MAIHDFTPRSQWSSSFSYMLVTIGAIVGLANIIQFPYLISQYGGLFLLFYIFFELTVSLPLLFTELSIGRRGKQNPVGSIDIICLESGVSRKWRYIGWLCFLASFFTLSYYTVQAAFPLNYFLGSLNIISVYGVDEPTPVAMQGSALTDFMSVEVCFLLFLFSTMLVVIRGIHRGLEKISCILVPFYLVVLIALAIYVAFYGDFLSSVKALFSMNPDKPIFVIMIAAMSYAFFTLSVGMGSMIVYGSYLPYSASFRRSTICIAFVDVFVSLISYFIVFPLMLKTNDFVYHLTNHNVIYLFNGIDNGFVISALFFLCAVIAAWMSTIAMAETTVVTLVERFGLTRLRAAILIFISAAILGSFAALTHTRWMDAQLLDAMPIQGLLMSVTEKLLIPISAMCIIIFAGWIIEKNILRSELQFSPTLFRVWLFLVKYVSLALIIILLIVTIINI